MSSIIPTEEQKRAIEYDGEKICILACAGSGKTFTLTRKIARLINDFNIDPSRIVAITFTVMAANNLKIEISQILKNKHASSQMFVGTIHSFCAQILKQIKKSELDESKILTENQQFILLNRFWNRWEIQKVNATIGKTNLIDLLVSTFSIMKMESIDSKSVKKRHPEINRIFNLYKSFLEENGYYDFADLISRTHSYLTNSSDLKKAILSKYDYLFIDEYQDVDPLQEKIFKLLGERLNLCVVGDDDQSIYQFRGTDVNNILIFSKSPKCKTFVLTENRRSPKNILSIAENCIKNVSSRHSKSMIPVESNGLVIRKQFERKEEEIDFIRSEIQRLMAAKRVNSFGDIGILMRSVSSYGKDYIDSLNKIGIPCLVKGGRNLFDTQEVKKVVSVLEWYIKEPYLASNLLLLREVFSGVVNEEEIGDEEEPFEQFSKEKAAKIGLTKEDIVLLKSFVAIREKYYENKFGSLLEIALETISCLNLMRKDNPDTVLYNIAQLTQIISEYETIANTKRLEYLCGYFKAYAQRAYDEAMPIPSSANAVNILTVHQSKGLEFDYVFIPMLVHLRFPVERNQRRWLIDDDLFSTERYYNSEENERRLFYVACTRARKGLYLLCSKDVGLAKHKTASLFYEEAVRIDLPEKNIAPQRRSKKKKEEEILVSSYSSLEYYLTCPYRYKLLIKYNLATPANPFFQFGKLIHAVLGYINSSYAADSKIALEDIENYYNILFENYFKRPNIPNYVVAKQKLRGLKAIRNYYDRKLNWLDRIKFVENDFEFITQKAFIKGRYDLIIENSKNGIAIIDFKTGNSHDYLRTDFQMQVYSLGAIQRQMNVEKAILYYVEHDEEVLFNVNNRFVERGKETLEFVIEGIISERFDPTPGETCGRCEVNNLCEEYTTKGKKHERSHSDGNRHYFILRSNSFDEKA